MTVVVVGGGFAGVSAAFAARRAGARVTLVHHGAGASGLYSGAIDGALMSDERASLRELCQALGLRLGAGGFIATREGVVRRSIGADASLLDLSALAGKRVGVVDAPRDDWDGPLLARAFAESDFARETGTRFELVPLPLLEQGYQKRVSSFDFAASLELAERPRRLIELLKAEAPRDGWLFGPWLGLSGRLAAELTRALGVPVGEVTSPPGGVAGARFESRRDAALTAGEVTLVRGRVTRVAAERDGVTLTLEDGQALPARALVLATGGFVSGGVELVGSLSGAEPAGFALSLVGLPQVALRGEPARPVSSLFGVDLAARGVGLLECAGIPHDARGRVPGAPRIVAAGDVTAPLPPSAGHALLSGRRAGTAAASIARGEALE